MTRTFEFTLEDDPNSDHQLKGRIVEENGALSIFVDGYGNAAVAPGEGVVAALVLQDGNLRLLAFPDYHSEEPEHIELEDAREEEEEE